MNSYTLICIIIFEIAIGIIELSTTRKLIFLTLFQFLTRLLTSKYLKLFSIYLVGEMERCEKRAFQHLKMRKKSVKT